IPAALMFDGCRTRERLRTGLYTVIGLYLLLAAQTIRLIPPRYALDAAELERRSGKILEMELGYHRIDVSMMLAGASWGILAVREQAGGAALRGGLAAASLAVVYA